MFRTLIRNILSNWAGFAVAVGVAFFLTPYVLHSLVAARYGIWSLVISLTGYYGLLDVGLRQGVTQYMIRSLAVEDFQQMNRTTSTAFVGLLACAVITIVIALAVSILAPHVFAIPPDIVGEARWCILVVAAAIAVQFVCFPFSSVFTATQRFDLANLIGISIKLATAGGIFSALRFGWGLPGSQSGVCDWRNHGQHYPLASGISHPASVSRCPTIGLLAAPLADDKFRDMELPHRWLIAAAILSRYPSGRNLPSDCGHYTLFLGCFTNLLL